MFRVHTLGFHNGTASRKTASPIRGLNERRITTCTRRPRSCSRSAIRLPGNQASPHRFPAHPPRGPPSRKAAHCPRHAMRQSAGFRLDFLRCVDRRPFTHYCTVRPMATRIIPPLAGGKSGFQMAGWPLRLNPILFTLRQKPIANRGAGTRAGRVPTHRDAWRVDTTRK